MKPIPRNLCQSKTLKSSLKILVTNAQLSVTLATDHNFGAPHAKYGGVFVFMFWGLRGLCFQDTQYLQILHISFQKITFIISPMSYNVTQSNIIIFKPQLSDHKLYYFSYK